MITAGIRTVFLALLLPALILGGCEGGGGMQGPAGPSGPDGGPGIGNGITAIADAGEINAEVFSATVGSPPTIEFRLSDERGLPVTGLPAASVSFAIARLVPGTDGGASEWQSYITRVEQADGSDPDLLASAVQATTENGSNGTLTDNDDGSYIYQYAVDLDNAAVPYEASLPHRVGLEIRGFAETTGNAVFTFRPSDGALSGFYARDIVATDSCNVCHDKLSLHGGARFDTQYCVTCHNPGSVDQDSGNTVDFSVMTHKIHSGENLPSVAAGGQYVIYGFGESEHDYSHVAYPQDIRNCRSCHDENNAATPDAVNWLLQPTREACGSCHENVNFETGAGHTDANLAAANAECTICHTPDGIAGSIDESHAILEQRAAGRYQFNIVDVTDTAPGEFPSITFSITNPATGEAYDIQNDDPFVQGAGASRIAIDLGWSTTDYQNTGSGSDVPGFRPGSPAQMVSLNPLFGGASDNGDGTFSITSNVSIPPDVTGSGLVAIEGHPAEDVDGDASVERIPVRGATDFFAITDSPAVPRREVVTVELCLNCHQQLSVHGNNRTDNVQLCAGCHNADATDIRGRMEGGIDATNAPDGVDEQSIDLKRMIHRIHYGADSDSGVYLYGFGGSLHDYSKVEYPGSLNRCTACHAGDSYYPVGLDVLATTIDSGADLADPTDDINITANASACSSCHESASAKAHMRSNGGAFDATQTAEGTLISASAGTVIEACTVCHGQGRVEDVRDVHGF